MNGCAKKIELAAQVEGEDGQWFVKCDFHQLKPNRPVAVLFWGPGMDIRGALYVPLDPELLSESSDEGVAYRYLGDPIQIPKYLIEMRPAPLSEAGFRLGFFRLPSD
jgi:hypothetical protein